MPTTSGHVQRLHYLARAVCVEVGPDPTDTELFFTLFESDDGEHELDMKNSVARLLVEALANGFPVDITHGSDSGRIDSVATGGFDISPAMVLVRHCDVDAGGDDPDLNAAGRARAQQLRHALADAALGAIYVSPFKRTQQSAEPVAADHGLTPVVLDDVAAVIDAIRGEPAASQVLVVGHSDTVPDIIAGLGGPTVPAIGPGEFDNLYVLARQRLVHLRYGARNLVR